MALLLGCQSQMYGRGSFVAEAPTPVIRADVSVQISFFGIPLAGAQDVVFVLDHSGSMSGIAAGFAGEDVGMSKTTSTLVGIAGQLAGPKGHSKMEAAKAELVHTLQAMPNGTRFMIIFFDDELAAFAPDMTTLDPYTRDAAINFVHGIKPGGSTAAVPALRLAYKAGAARVILLSDGLANTGGGADDLLAEARGQIQRGVRFDTVGLGIDQDSSLLNALAAESGGLAIKR
ncbi:MAG TPA: VWA domain-containing protein [Kofleriaceae bacterium]